MRLSGPETDTLLAALRHWQRTVIMPNPDLESVRSAHPEHFEAHAPLDAATIDDLCERLNCQSIPIAHVVVADRPDDAIEKRFYEAYFDPEVAQEVLNTIRAEQPEWQAAVIALEVL